MAKAAYGAVRIDDVARLAGVSRATAADPSVLGVVLVNTTEAVLAGLPARLRGRVVSVGIGAPGVPSVDVDNATAVEILLRHLHAQGWSRIAMITGPRWLPCTRRQDGAYARVMDDVGAQVRSVTGDFTTAAGRRAAAELLERWPDVDAVYAANDATALGALSLFGERGVGVPGDIAVAGFDDIPVAPVLGLTTATHPVDDIAAAAVRTLLDGAADAVPETFFDSTPVPRRTA